MAKINYTQMTFTQYFAQKRINKNDFFHQINQIIDWKRIENILNKYYNKGQDIIGRKAYPALLLFKMSLLQTWYGLSDYEVEDCLKDRLSFMNFCGTKIEDDVPDHSILSRFRTVLTKAEVYDMLLKDFNDQLEAQGILVKQGVSVDASITDSPRKPKGKKVYMYSAENPEQLVEKPKKGVDQEGSWVKKGSQVRYGYKRHYAADKDTGLVVGVETSKASAHETNYLAACLSKSNLSPGSEVLADKGYASKSNNALLAQKKLKNRICSKGSRAHPLSSWAKLRNTLISKVRYRIERVFGSIKRWFQGGVCRYVGQAKTHSQHVLEALAYNLYRLPRIVMSMECQK